jgi:hypothetical protein
MCEMLTVDVATSAAISASFTRGAVDWWAVEQYKNSFWNSSMGANMTHSCVARSVKRCLSHASPGDCAQDDLCTPSQDTCFEDLCKASSDPCCGRNQNNCNDQGLPVRVSGCLIVG